MVDQQKIHQQHKSVAQYLQHSKVWAKRGEINIIRNGSRDLMAKLLLEVHHDMQVEPKLSPLTAELMEHWRTIDTNKAKFGIWVRGFSIWGEQAF